MRYLCLGLIFGFLVAVNGPPPAQAEMYKYRDQEGNLRFTDNLAQIPEDQRPQAETLEEIEPDKAAAPKTSDGDDAARKTESAPDDDPAADIAVDQALLDELNQRKKELDSEFAGLMSEKYALLQEKERLTGLASRDVEARGAYERKVADLNDRIDDYKQRRDAYEEECAQVKAALEPPSAATP